MFVKSKLNSNNIIENNNDYILKIDEIPNDNLQLIVVIPVYNELEIGNTHLNLIDNIFDGFSVEVYFVINSSIETPQKIKDRNTFTINYISALNLYKTNKNIKIYTFEANELPIKKSGVGYARKLGMDLALKRFKMINNLRGVIVSLDADTVVEKNYLAEIFNFFDKNPKTTGVSINFEHKSFDAKPNQVIRYAATVYEIHLRYYIQALRYIKHPHAFHTIGSAFAVRAKIYEEQKGMVINKSGEDFYFLQKVIPLGYFSDLNSTTVYPSPRITDRVIFGTGVAVRQIITDYFFTYPTYNLDAFLNLKILFSQLNYIYENPIRYRNIELHKVLIEYLESFNFLVKIKEIKENTSNFENFKKRFFRNFGTFEVLKYLNFSHRNFYNKNDVLIEAQKLLILYDKTVNYDTGLLLDALKNLNKEDFL